MARGFAALVPVILLVIMGFLAISGAARPLSGEVWPPAGEAVSGDGVLQFLQQMYLQKFLQQMYLQKLGAGPSCRTNSSNGGCPQRP
ncbi:hypothetical protein HU200_021591 [Digitaria exilis]|uniref:Uncharacterized protein n=1 Tax=Digitaria exilis TaxID=1010633 RepID=A0A835KAZ1_9POAL|nr:hypothetical protein HU200_021591 [Digitaria exilis]